MDNAQKKSLIFIIITAFCFGTMEIALKIGGGDFTALQLTFLRFLIGGLVLLPFAVFDLKKRAYRLTPGDFVYLLALALVGICLSMTLFQIGVMNCNANTASVIISANPVFTMIFAAFIIKEKFTRKKALVLLICVMGLLFVANPLNMVAGNTAKGLIYTGIASVLFGLYSALGKLRVGVIGGTAQNSFSFLIGSAVELAVLLVRGEPIIHGITLSNLPVLLYVGFVVTGLGYYCFLKAIELTGPSNASVAFFIKPVIAMVLAAAILSEPITINVVIGVALILIGSIINMKKDAYTELADSEQ